MTENIHSFPAPASAATGPTGWNSHLQLVNKEDSEGGSVTTEDGAISTGERWLIHQYRSAGRDDLANALDRARMNVSVVGSNLRRICTYSFRHRVKPSVTIKRALAVLEYLDELDDEQTVLRVHKQGMRLLDAPRLEILWDED